MNGSLDDKVNIAWNMLKEKGCKINEMMLIKNTFTSISENEYPFINRRYIKGSHPTKITYYSEIKPISNLEFQSENEVILANAIYENTKDNFNLNDFIQSFKYVSRLLNIPTEWK